MNLIVLLMSGVKNADVFEKIAVLVQKGENF